MRLQEALSKARAELETTSGSLQAAAALKQTTATALGKWRSQLKALETRVKVARSDIERLRGSKQDLERDVSNGHCAALILCSLPWNSFFSGVLVCVVCHISIASQ